MTRSFFQTAIALVALNTLVQLGWIIIIHNPYLISYNNNILLLIIALVIFAYTASASIKGYYFYQNKHYVSMVLAGMMILWYAILLLTFYQIIQVKAEPSTYLIMYYLHLFISALFALSLLMDKQKANNLRLIGLFILLFSSFNFVLEFAFGKNYPALTQKLSLWLAIAAVIIPVLWITYFRSKIKQFSSDNDQLLDTP